MSASAARKLAHTVVTKVRERKGYSHEILDRQLSDARLGARDAAFATRLAYGTVQTQGVLDEALNRFLAHPNRVEPKVRDALQVAAYELLFARTPARAAVSEGVELTRSVRAQAAGLANAVLRKLAEEAPSFPWGDPSTDPAALARLYGHPEWLAALFIAELGFDRASELMAANNEPAPLYLARNPFTTAGDTALIAELTAEGAEPQPCVVPGCIHALNPACAVASQAVAEGRAVIADAAAQLVPRLLRPRPGDLLVDVAAGRGTKTLLIQAAALGEGGLASVVSVDIHGFKTTIRAERLTDLAVDGVTSLTGDATDPLTIEGMPPAGTVDALLVDAPCSGLGTLRRHPEQRWRMRPDDIDALAALGSRLLEASALLVRPGGFVVYSTCTVTRRENQDVIAGFLEGTGAFSIDDVRNDVPAAWQHFVTPEGAFQSLPAPDGPDGHFAARLIRG